MDRLRIGFARIGPLVGGGFFVGTTGYEIGRPSGDVAPSSRETLDQLDRVDSCVVDGDEYFGGGGGRGGICGLGGRCGLGEFE